MSESSHDEAMIAHCLVLLASKEPQSSDPPPRCDEPPSAETENKYWPGNITKSEHLKLERIEKNIIPSKDLPSSNQWKHDKNSTARGIDSCSEMVWDSRKAGMATKQINLFESIVPHERKESAFKLFHKNDYEMNNTFLAKVMQTEPSHGLNWSPSKKRKFSKGIVVKNGTKNFAVVSKRLSKKAGDCQAYYYSRFKQTSDYKRMKRATKRQVKTRSSHNYGTVLSDECE